MVYLTIIVPVFNETKTIVKILKKISNIKIKKQIIVVDDGSTDGTKKKILSQKNLVNKVIFHKSNLGKGAAIRSAQKFIKGKFVIIQDADLEYDPKDFKKLLIPLKKNYSKIVYGSRVLGKKRYKLNNFTSLSRIFFNHILTILSNILNSQSLTDAHTCYKVFDSKIFKSINLKENRFGFCPEVTTKISKLNYKIKEVPISYNGREYSDGKKIGIFDGFDAIKCLIKYKYFA